VVAHVPCFIWIVRKNKRELVEMIDIWSAIESVAARLACEKATDEEIVELRADCIVQEEPRASMSMKTGNPAWCSIGHHRHEQMQPHARINRKSLHSYARHPIAAMRQRRISKNMEVFLSNAKTERMRVRLV
jgi:DNA-binding FadR family transcriptional regulator